MARLALSLVASLVVLPSVARGQESPVPETGERVRIWTTQTTAPVIGQVLGHDATSLTLRPDGSDTPVLVKRDVITQVEVSRGRRSRGKSVLIGALVGAGTAVVAGLITGDNSPRGGLFSFDLTPTRKEAALLFSILTVPGGALIGALAGPGEDHWSTTLPASAKLSETIATPVPSLRFSFRF